MLKRQEMSDPNSCLNKARDDEPIFVLRAKDPIAAAVVRLWAAMAEFVHEREKIGEARQFANAMDQWRLRYECQKMDERLPVETSESRD